MLYYKIELIYIHQFRRETRPKILWNTGTKLNSEKEKDSGVASSTAQAVVGLNNIVTGVLSNEITGKSSISSSILSGNAANGDGSSWKYSELTLDEVCIDVPSNG